MLKIYLPIFLFFISTSAYAGPTSSVSSTRISQGNTSFDIRLGYTTDNERESRDDRVYIRQTVDYSFSDQYALRFVTRQNKLKSDHIEHDDFSIQHRFHLIERKQSGWDGGLRVAYTNNASNADSLELRTIAQIPLNQHWEYRNNLIFSHEVGAEKQSGLEFEARQEISRKIKRMTLGADLLNDFGNINGQSGYSDQDHEIGLFMKNKLPANFTSTIGYRTGLSTQANDHTFRLFLEKKF